MDIMINGITLEGDFMDADFVERYEAAAREMAQAAGNGQRRNYASFADSIREQCAAVDSFFNRIFGDGTAAKVFAGKEKNLMTHLVAVEELTRWANGEKKKLNDFVNKYSQRQHAAAQRQQAMKIIEGKKGNH